MAALMQGVLNAEPTEVVEALPDSSVAWALMILFGVVVVLLLLNLLIARFSKTFDLVCPLSSQILYLTLTPTRSLRGPPAPAGA